MAQGMPKRVDVMFRSSDVTNIVGMQQDMIRLWRARGHLPKKEGRGAIYTAHEVAEIMVRYELSNYGITPARSLTIGQGCASNVIRNALLNYPTCCEIAGPKDSVEMLIKEHSTTDKVALWLSGCEKSFDFVIRRDSDEPKIASDMSLALDDGEYKTAFVLNLQKCAEILVAKSKTKLFMLEYPRKSGEEFIRKTLGDL